MFKFGGVHLMLFVDGKAACGDVGLLSEFTSQNCCQPWKSPEFDMAGYCPCCRKCRCAGWQDPQVWLPSWSYSCVFSWIA